MWVLSSSVSAHSGFQLRSPHTNFWLASGASLHPGHVMDTALSDVEAFCTARRMSRRHRIEQPLVGSSVCSHWRLGAGEAVAEPSGNDFRPISVGVVVPSFRQTDFKNVSIQATCGVVQGLRSMSSFRVLVQGSGLPPHWTRPTRPPVVPGLGRERPLGDALRLGRRAREIG